MPTYEYACSSCDTTHDIVQKMTDPTLTDCPGCGEPTLRKVFNGVGVVFKGSGFYQTDYRSDSYKQGAEADKPVSESKDDKKKPKKSDDNKPSKE